jgi:hypothetical protein
MLPVFDSPVLARVNGEAPGAGKVGAQAGDAKRDLLVHPGAVRTSAVAAGSERTVETHVRSILAKLGYSTRTEIATWCPRTFKVSMSAPFAMAIRNRAYRSCGGRLVVMLAAAWPWCRGLRARSRAHRHHERRGGGCGQGGAREVRK